MILLICRRTRFRPLFDQQNQFIPIVWIDNYANVNNFHQCTSELIVFQQWFPFLFVSFLSTNWPNQQHRQKQKQKTHQERYLYQWRLCVFVCIEHSHRVSTKSTYEHWMKAACWSHFVSLSIACAKRISTVAKVRRVAQQNNTNWIQRVKTTTTTKKKNANNTHKRWIKFDRVPTKQRPEKLAIFEQTTKVHMNDRDRQIECNESVCAA